MLICPIAIVIFTASRFSVFYNASQYFSLSLLKCFPMYVQTCEKVDVIITLESYPKNVASSLIMLSEEITNN